MTTAWNFIYWIHGGSEHKIKISFLFWTEMQSIDLSRITLQWANIKKWGRGSGGQFHTNHYILSTRASSWCLCLQECGKGLLESIARKFAVIWKIEQNRKVHCECGNILKWTLQWWKLHLTILSIVKVCYTERFATTISSTTQPCNVGTMLQAFKTMLQQCCNTVLWKKSSLWIVLCNMTFIRVLLQ